jgi:ribosome-associated toxin RatA of RatAB toxin-antitoxin module
MIKSVVNIEAPREHVFKVLSDFSQYELWLPGCKQSKIITAQESVVETEFVIKSIKTMTMGLRFELVPVESMMFRMIKGTDLKSYQGSWRLMDAADGSGTVVIGEIEMDAGAMVPGFMVSRMAKKAIEETVSALRRRIGEVPFEVEKKGKAFADRDRPRRLKRILHVMRTQDGYRVWAFGQTYFAKSRD